VVLPPPLFPLFKPACIGVPEFAGPSSLVDLREATPFPPPLVSQPVPRQLWGDSADPVGSTPQEPLLKGPCPCVPWLSLKSAASLLRLKELGLTASSLPHAVTSFSSCTLIPSVLGFAFRPHLWSPSAAPLQVPPPDPDMFKGLETLPSSRNPVSSGTPPTL